MVVPGMSAGTVIILVGLYGALIGHICNFYKGKRQLREAVIFAVPLGAGAGVGILTLAKLLDYLIENFSLPTFSLFAGFVVGVIPMIFMSALNPPKHDTLTPPDEKEPATPIPAAGRTPRPRWYHGAFAVIFCAIVVTLALCKTGDGGVKELNASTAVMLVICGAIAAADMMIPGISGSFMLLILGYYNTILDAVSGFPHINIPVLLLFGAGLPIGLFVASKGIGYFLKKFHVGSYMAITGLLIGSVAAMFIMRDTYNSGTGAWGIVCAVFAFIFGAIVTYSSTYFRTRRQSKNGSTKPEPPSLL